MASLGFVPISKPEELSQNEVYNAFAHYTGLPEAVSGGIGFFGFNIAMQSGQAKLMLSKGIYKGSFLSALRTEMFWGTLAMALILTAVDPQHKIEGGGLDETRFYKEHLEGTWTTIKSGMMTTDLPGYSFQKGFV
jgi:hypothetical protein